MQNNVTELTQKLLRALDNNYNVIDMPAVIEIISLLEKVTITKELLETTRIGKHVNELRRNASNESLAKRAKELVKKWRSLVIPGLNGQIKTNSVSSSGELNVPDDLHTTKKRPPKDALENAISKRPKVNGQVSELDFSDNSNSSFKDVINSSNSSTSTIPSITTATITTTSTYKISSKRDVSATNSDSNSSLPDVKLDPLLEQQQPKKRGRKKGSKNHKNLLDEAETSFSNKLNVSRGNAKVKTTKELLADLQIKSAGNAVTLASSKPPIEDLNERAAKLTERVSIIDQKLNATSNRYKNSHKKLSFGQKNSSGGGSSSERVVIESGCFSNVKKDKGRLKSARSSNNNSSASEDEIIIVDDEEKRQQHQQEITFNDDDDEEREEEEVVVEEKIVVPKSLTEEEALALLPPLDRSSSVLDDFDEHPCYCQLVKNKTDFSVEQQEGEEDDKETEGEIDKNDSCLETYKFIEKTNCPAKVYLSEKYHLGEECLDEKVLVLHTTDLPNVNGNYSEGGPKPDPEMSENGLYVNVVPSVVNKESIPKVFNYEDGSGVFREPASENYKKYSISKSDDYCVEKTDEDYDDDCNSNSGNVEKNDEKDSSVNDVINDCMTKRKSCSETFKEWHEVVETRSYNGEILKILPYVIID